MLWDFWVVLVWLVDFFTLVFEFVVFLVVRAEFLAEFTLALATLALSVEFALNFKFFAVVFEFVVLLLEFFVKFVLD